RERDPVILGGEVAAPPGARAIDRIRQRARPCRWSTPAPQGRRSPRGVGMDALARLNELKLPFAELIGIEFTEAAPEKVVAEIMVRDDLCTRRAVLHGGAIMAFADTLGAAGTFLNLPEGAGTTTIASKTNFIYAAAVA